MKNILLPLFLLAAVGYSSSAQITPLEIWQIQGNTNVSTYQGQSVKTTANIITAVGDGFFFLQCPDNRSDQDPGTSDGIYVADNKAANRKVGDRVQVQGTVFELNNRTQIGQGSVQVTLVSSSEELPKAIALGPEYPMGTPSSLNELEAVEGMLVQFEGITAGPADWRSMVPVVAGPNRPFREPGIHYPGLPSLPVWDGNPEIFWLLPNALTAPNNRFIAAQTFISATGPLFQSAREYILFPETYSLGVSPSPRSVRKAKDQELTIGCLNLRRLQTLEDNFDQKAKKIAKYILEMLAAPDLIAIQEVGSAEALSVLRFFLLQIDPSLKYTPFFLAGNDDIHLAFLAREDKFTQMTVEQLGKQESMPGGGNLFGRPPLLFTAVLNHSPQTSISVLNIHLRSLLGIEGTNERFVREKRYRQSIAVAEMVQEKRIDNLLLVGDFNAFPFSDGYVDVLNQISGHPSLGAQYPVQPLVNPPLQRPEAALPPGERYSYVFEGSAQLLDHALAGKLEGLELIEMSFARANADYPDAYAPNEQLVQRASDHDGFVIYLQPETATAIQPKPVGAPLNVYPNPVKSGQTLHISVPAHYQGDLQVIASNGRLVTNLPKQKGNRIVRTTISEPGFYYLKVVNEDTLPSIPIVVLSSK